MTCTIRPFHRDFAGVALLLNAINPEPMTADELEAAHARFPADGLRHRLVAVSPSGDVVGYANVSRIPVIKAGKFWLTLIVAPGARRQGIATSLLAEVDAWVRSNGGTDLETGVPDDDQGALAFASARGFRVASTQFTSVLQVDGFDEAPFEGVVDGVAESGLRFFTLAEQPGEETVRRLYELYKITDLDSPGFEGVPAAQYPPFERWHDELFGKGLVVPEGLFIAADGDRFIGCTILQKEGDQGWLYTEYTGVLREYRCRQVGLALKLLSIRFGKQYGAPCMTTKNDSGNAPMLAVNQKLGYVKSHGRAWLLKTL